MTRALIARLAIDTINDANANIARLNMHKGGWLSLTEKPIYEYHQGRIATANELLDAVVREESADIIEKARRAA